MEEIMATLSEGLCVCLGIDPGRASGASLVDLCPVPGTAPYPRLRGVWAVSGADDRLWYRRAVQAVREAAEQLGEGEEKICFLEQIPVTMKDNSIEGVKRGHAAWAGLGKRWGAWQSILFAHDWEVRVIDQKDWTKACGVKKSKEAAGGPMGRVREAQNRIYGFSKVETLKNEKIFGDVAESALIALAGTLKIKSALTDPLREKPGG
jgi:hypothetical protein